MDASDASTPNQLYDLVIVGGSAGGLSTAISSLRSGLRRVRIIESSSRVALPDLIGPNQLDVGFGETVESVECIGDDIVVNTNRLSYRTRAVLVADRRADVSWTPPIAMPDSSRVHLDEVAAGTDQDVLVVGLSDHAVELTAQYVDAGNRVVLAAAGMDPTLLSPAAASALQGLERGRQATLLYRSTPQVITFVGEFPMVEFGDRRTPDLQFDHVVFASVRHVSEPGEVGVTSAALASGKVWFLGDPGEGRPVTTAPGWQVGPAMAEAAGTRAVGDPTSNARPQPSDDAARSSGTAREAPTPGASWTHMTQTRPQPW